MKKIILAIVLIIGVIIAGLAITARYIAPKINERFMKEDKAIVMQTVDQFLFNIRDGKIDEAYAVTLHEDLNRESLKDVELQKDLKNFIGQDSQLYKHRVTKFLGGKYTVQYLTTTNFSDGRKGQIGIAAVLDKKDDLWKITGFNWTTPPDKIW